MRKGAPLQPRGFRTLFPALGLTVSAICLLLLACEQPLPPYTPSPSDLDKAYAQAVDDVSSAIAVFHRFRSEAVKKLEALPNHTLESVQRAASCDVPIDSLASDPRTFLRSPLSDLASQDLAAARNAPRLAAHDLAAAHVASPANRDAIDTELSEYTRASIGGDNHAVSPALQGYLEFLTNDDAYVAYLEDTNAIHESYSSAERMLTPVLDGLIVSFLEAPGSNCTPRLYAQYEKYMRTLVSYSPALLRYYDSYIEAATKYRDAIEEAR